MAVDFDESYHLFNESDDIENLFNGNGIDNESIKEVDGRERFRFNFYLSQLKYVKASFQTTVVCGVIFGLFATFLWWINLETSPSCFGKWHNIPSKMKRITMISEVARVVVIIFWPILMIAPICSWSMIKDSNMIFWCTIGGFVDVIDRLFIVCFQTL